MRGSLQQIELAKQQALAELAHDRARSHARIDEFRNLIAVLEEGFQQDLNALHASTLSERNRITNRHHALKEHFLGEIDKETRTLAELEGNSLADTAASDEQSSGTELQQDGEGDHKPKDEAREVIKLDAVKELERRANKMIGHNSRRAKDDG